MIQLKTFEKEDELVNNLLKFLVDKNKNSERETKYFTKKNK